jgi:hypothetical protein
MESWILERKRDGAYTAQGIEGAELPPGSWTEVVSRADVLRMLRKLGISQRAALNAVRMSDDELSS